MPIPFLCRQTTPLAIAHWLWIQCRIAGGDACRSWKSSAFPSVGEVEKGHGGLFPRAVQTLALLAAAGMSVPAAHAQEVPMARPMMISEAKLPVGFPPPGPVGEVIVKTYPAHRLARVRAQRSNDNGMFMQLFRHIERHEIAMTAPVEMVWQGDSAKNPESMAFLYRSGEIGSPGADPQDGRVVVEDIPEIKVVSLGLRGAYGRETADKGMEKLRAWLATHPEWEAAGAPRTLAYNSPFVPNFLKYAEIQLPIAAANSR